MPVEKTIQTLKDKIAELEHRLSEKEALESSYKQAREEIFENKALLAAIVDGFEGFLYVTTHDFKLAYMNTQCIRHIGKEALGQVCYQAIHGRDSVCPFCVHDQVQRKETVRFEMKNPQDNRWYSSVNSPIHHADGTISLLALVRDIHQRKRAETALKEAEIHLRKENIFLRSRIKERHKFGNIVGKSPAMQEVYEQILNAAATDATVIIYGEPGTGKELVAHAIHDMSERRHYRFVPVHCGAIPENLTESEFFGYKRGAFSGADADKPGYVDYADRGTLFLDEIGEISLHMQVNLLRVIEGSGYTPVGSSQVKRSDIRIIAATNRDLKVQIERQMMRQDFYYRIHILPINLPPLRDRKEDLPLLVEHFLLLHGDKRNVPPITGKMLDKIQSYEWPGNVRELQNVIIRYCSLRQLDLTGEGPVASPAAALTGTEKIQPGSGTLKENVEAFEREIILRTLEDNRWHRGRVSAILGVDRKTLFTKMKRYGLMDT